MKKIFLLSLFLFNFIHVHNVHSGVMEGIPTGVKAGVKAGVTAGVTAALTAALTAKAMPVITGWNYPYNPAILAVRQALSIGAGVGVAVRTAGVGVKKKKAVEIAAGVGMGWIIFRIIFRQLMLLTLPILSYSDL